MSKLLDEHGDWDYKKLGHWYDDDFLKHPLVTTGNQRPLGIARHEWQTSANAAIFYDDAKRDLLMAGIFFETELPIDV